MYCPKCGIKLAREAIFCHKCGTKMPEELLHTASDDFFEAQPAEDYDAIFSFPTEIKEKKPIETVKNTAKTVSDFIHSDPSVSESAPIANGLSFDIPDDWNIEPEKKPEKKVAKEAETVSYGEGFDIPDDWESISDSSTKATFEDTDYSEDDLNFEIPDDWSI